MSNIQLACQQLLRHHGTSIKQRLTKLGAKNKVETLSTQPNQSFISLLHE